MNNWSKFGLENPYFDQAHIVRIVNKSNESRIVNKSKIYPHFPNVIQDCCLDYMMKYLLLLSIYILIIKDEN